MPLRRLACLALCLTTLLLSAGVVQAGAGKALQKVEATLGSAKLTLELAKTPAQRYQGLSDREAMAPDTGMAFLYDRPAIWGMVMRRMRFGLDFIWVNNLTVVGVTHRVPPPGPGEAPRHAVPPRPVDMVIEAPHGWAQKNGIKAGTKITVVIPAD